MKIEELALQILKVAKEEYDSQSDSTYYFDYKDNALVLTWEDGYDLDESYNGYMLTLSYRIKDSSYFVFDWDFVDKLSPESITVSYPEKMDKEEIEILICDIKYLTQ